MEWNEIPVAVEDLIPPREEMSFFACDNCLHIFGGGKRD